MSDAQLPKPSASGPFASNAQVTMMIAQYEASERGQVAVRPVHLLLAAAQMEKAISGYVLERAGVTYDKVDAYLRSLEEERKANRRPIGFSPAAIELLEQAASLAKRWNHRLIGSQHLTGALAESADREVIASFAYCSASGRDVTAILMDRMREVGLVG